MHKIIKFLLRKVKFLYRLRFIQNLLFKYSSKEIVTLKKDFKISLKTGDLISNYIFHFHIWEPNISNYLNTKINELENRSFIDIGANIGYFSILIAHQNSKCKVYSYEPTPQIFKQLDKNVKLNSLSNIVLKNNAISGINGKLKLFAGHTMNSGSTGIFENDGSTEYFSVDCVTLKEEIHSFQYPPKIIKIDTEGSEQKILSNLDSIVEILPNDVEFIVEINPELIGFENANKIVTDFQKLSFKAYEIENSYNISFYISESKYGLHQLTSPLNTQKDILFRKSL